MSATTLSKEEGPGEISAHFMIRVSRPSGGDARSVRGMIERLGTGEKHAFFSAAELLRLITEWEERR